MPEIRDPRREAFARAWADGFVPREAYDKAGYKAQDPNIPGEVARIAGRDDVLERVTELRAEMDWGSTPDIAPVINELRRLAKKAGDMDTAAAMIAARGLLAEAAKLKRLLSEPDAPAMERPPPEPPMSNAEWLAKHAPQG